MTTLTAYTDYPFRELGDTPHTSSPHVREVQIISWNGDKYCDLIVDGQYIPMIKRWYLYTSPDLTSASQITEEQLEPYKHRVSGFEDEDAE